MRWSLRPEKDPSVVLKTMEGPEDHEPRVGTTILARLEGQQRATGLLVLASVWSEHDQAWNVLVRVRR